MAWGCSLHGTGCSLATRVAASVARGCRRHGEAQRLQRGAQGDGSHLGLAAREGADDARLAAGQRGHAAAQLRLQLGEAGGTERLRGDHPDGPVVEPRVPLSEDAHVREEGAWHLHEDGGRAGGRAGGLFLLKLYKSRSVQVPTPYRWYNLVQYSTWLYLRW